MKILLQRLWESKIDWDDPVPPFYSRCLATMEIRITPTIQVPCTSLLLSEGCHSAIQLHGFCDASEDAYTGVVYLRGEDIRGNVHVALVM